MARLPQPGGDNNQWGEILNQFLLVSLNDNGTLKPITNDNIAPADIDGTPTTPSMRTLGTGAQQAAAGDDPRITGAEQTANKGQIDGYASLDGSGKVPIEQIPDSDDPTVDAFEFTYAAAPVSQSGWSLYSQTNIWFGGSVRSNNSDTDNIVFRTPTVLTSGTWNFILFHWPGTNRGIVTIEVSADGLLWTPLTTIDGYSASSAPTRSEVTGLTLTTGVCFIRFSTPTRNPDSTGYFSYFNALSGVRTGV